MQAVFKREFQSYMTSMIGCVLIAVLIAFTGIYFLAYNLNAGYPYFSFALEGTLFVFLAAIPILTMKCFTEERKNKTDQLLLTSSLSVTKVVLGKYFAMVAILLLPNLMYLIFPWIIKLQGTAYILQDYLSILLFFMLGCVYISIGMFISSLTESQIIACISTFGILLISYLWKGIINFLPGNAIGSFLSKWLGKICLPDVFSAVRENNIFDISGLILYLSVIILFIFLTIQSIQKRRWS